MRFALMSAAGLPELAPLARIGAGDPDSADAGG